jgi:hypothetical protein
MHPKRAWSERHLNGCHPVSEKIVHFNGYTDIEYTVSIYTDHRELYIFADSIIITIIIIIVLVSNKEKTINADSTDTRRKDVAERQTTLHHCQAHQRLLALKHFT